MPRVTLTDLVIRNLPASKRSTVYYDASLPSFGIRVGKHRKAFVITRGIERRRITLGRYPYLTLKDARMKAHAYIAGAYDDTATGIKASRALDEYLEVYAKTRRPNTVREVRRLLNVHFLKHFPEAPINLITTADLTRIIDKLLDKPSEAIKAQAVISTFLTWARRREYIDKNPLSGIPLPAKPKSRDRVLSDRELAAILKAALRIINTPYGALIVILAFTGLRKTEAYSLQWDWIDNQHIRIPKELAKNGVELLLPNTVRGYLSSVPKNGPRLFPANVDWTNAKRKFDALSGVSGWVLHDLRRTLSTKMAEWEIAPPDVVEAILNHVSGSRSAIQRTYDRASRMVPMRRALSVYADRLIALMKTP